MAWTKIKDGLFIGDRDSVQDYDLIEPNSITYFINTAASELDFFWEGVEFLTFCWEDHADFECFDSQGLVVDQILSFVDEGIRLGHSVLVYSNRGMSRCVACAAAYMMTKYGWGCDKVLEFFESKRLAMDLNPGLLRQLHALDWHLQQRRLKQALAEPSERRRLRALEANRAKLLTWRSGAGLLEDPNKTEDLSADEMILVNSYVNGRSAFTHSHQGLPPPPQGAEARRHAATALRWIDEDAMVAGNEGFGGIGSVPVSEAAWEAFVASSQPILDINEKIEWLEDDEVEPPDTTRSL